MYNVPFTVDPTYSPELQQEQRTNAQRRSIAQALMQQSMGQQQHMPPGANMSWLAPIAQALQGALSGKVQSDADAADKAIPAKADAQNKVAMAAYNQSLQGAPPPADLQESDPANVRTGGGMDAIKAAMSSNNPKVYAAANRDYTAETLRMQHDRDLAQKHRDRQADLAMAKELKVKEEIPEDWQKHLPEVTQQGNLPGTFKGSDGDLMQMVFKDGKLTGYKNVNTLPKPASDTTGGEAKGSNIKEVADPDSKFPGRVLLIDVNKYKPGGTLGAPGVVGVAKSETVQGGRDAKRSFSMSGIGATLTSARNILEGKGGTPLPTGSGFGNAYDYVGSLVGYSPTGAKEADAMRAIGGALVAKMPRMEGPQSDKDTANYKEMAGRIGDPTIPIERRLKAMEEVERLWAKYENVNPGVFNNGTSGTSTPTDPGTPLSPAEKSRLDELRRKRALK